MNKNAYMNGEIYIGDFEEFSISVDIFHPLSVYTMTSS